MATKTTVTLVDDLDGNHADETMTFSLDGRPFEIDLSEGNAGRLREALQPFVAAARRIRPGKANGTTRPGQRMAPRPDREQAQAVRDWARARGITVADRGRISAEVLAAFDAEH